MLNDVLATADGGFEVYHTDESRDALNHAAIENLRQQRYAAVQAGQHGLVISLDAELEFLLKNV